MTNKQEVLRALEQVHDPCSLMYGNNVTFAELGMIESVEVDGSKVTVQLLLDDPNCLYMSNIMGDIDSAISSVGGVEEVEIHNRGDVIWTEDRLTPVGREKLEHHRKKRRAAIMQIAGLRR